MYPYSNNPNQDPYNQGNVPPYGPTGPGYQNQPPPYGPYNYQPGPQGQPPYYQYPPQPPRPNGYIHPAVKAFAIVILVLFVLAFIGAGRHGFFFFPVFPLIIFGIIMAATRGNRYRRGWNRHYYHHNRYNGYNNWQNNPYQYQNRPYYYDYNQAPPPPGYYGPQQPPQAQTQGNPQGWPEPRDPYKNDMENPY